MYYVYFKETGKLIYLTQHKEELKQFIPSLVDVVVYQ